jgi:hypothetical protein
MPNVIEHEKSATEIRVMELERLMDGVVRNVSSNLQNVQGSSIALIMAKTGTDKLTRHAYDRYYDIYFNEFRHKKGLRILEIGAEQGKSIQLWSEYFTDPAAIHGIAYGKTGELVDQKELACDWRPSACDAVKIFRGDQSDPKFLKTIHDKYKYDIIIDDGSHVPAHQLVSFKHLFQAVKPGGLYVMEDLETSYWNARAPVVYGYPVPHAGIGASPRYSAVEKLKQLIDVLMRFHMSHPSLHVFPDDDKILSVTFGQGLAVIRRATAAQLQHTPVIPHDVERVVHGPIDQWEAESAKSTP